MTGSELRDIVRFLCVVEDGQQGEEAQRLLGVFCFLFFKKETKDDEDTNEGGNCGHGEQG